MRMSPILMIISVEVKSRQGETIEKSIIQNFYKIKYANS